MVEKRVRNIEVKEENKIDTSIFKKKGNSKTFKGFLIQKIKEARKNNNPELVFLIKTIYDKYLESQEVINLGSWKGKSSFKVIENPVSYIITTYQRKDQDSKPEEIKTEIRRDEVDYILSVLKSLNCGEPIPTRRIGEIAYKMPWDEVFSNRPLHIRLNLILRLLDRKGIIKYRGGNSTYETQ